MAVKFTQSYRHGRFEFLPGPAIGFEDPDADLFFQKVAGAEPSDQPPVRVYTQEEVDIDPDTIFPTGRLVAETPLEEVEQEKRLTAQVQPDDVHVTTGG